MKNDKHILIVSYKLGISNGVGGRRWLNYGLELLRNGFNVHFLTYQKNIPGELSDYRERIHQIEGNYPQVLNRIPARITDKIRYRFWAWYLKTISYGTPFDEAKRTQKEFLSAVEKIIKEKKISHLIISGAPFSLLYFGTLIKKKFPAIKLISDYRDIWTNGMGYGIPSLPKKKLDEEISHEIQVLKKSDLVLVASKDIENSLRLIVPETKIMILQNFVNVTQFSEYVNNSKDIKKRNDICITHIGTVNKGTEKYWQNHFQLLESFNKNHDKKITSQFVGGKNPEVEHYVSANKLQNINFLSYKNPVEFGQLISDTDILLMFKNDLYPHSFPTKFFDYIYFRKPILCYSIKGTVTAEIDMNKIGFAFDDHTTQKEFDSAILKLVVEKNYNHNYDYEKYSLHNLTNNLIQKALN